ncbi:MAG: hypothetical protein HKP41_10890 [Desulfobacterales bacterium]|nr:hypothetical protein [Desulfobacterales bacterium]
MIGFEFLVKVNPGKRIEFLQAFEMVKNIDQLKKSRISLELIEEAREPNSFLWIEHWENDKCLSSYYQNINFMAMMGAIDVLGQIIRKTIILISEEEDHA